MEAALRLKNERSLWTQNTDLVLLQSLWRGHLGEGNVPGQLRQRVVPRVEAAPDLALKLFNNWCDLVHISYSGQTDRWRTSQKTDIRVDREFTSTNWLIYIYNSSSIPPSIHTWTYCLSSLTLTSPPDFWESSCSNSSFSLACTSCSCSCSNRLVIELVWTLEQLFWLCYNRG